MSLTNLTVMFTSDSDSLLNYWSMITEYATIVNLCIFLQPVCIVGIASNIVNILVFFRQGFQDGVNITLTSLAVSDIGALIAFQAYIINYNPLILDKNLPFRKDVLGLITHCTQEYFIKSSNMITAFVSLERCVSVSFPLMVKSIFTRRVVVIANVFMLICPVFLVVIPTAIHVSFDWMFSPEMNKTFISLIFTNTSYMVASLQYYISEIFFPVFNFLTIIVCSAIIFIRLRSHSVWRKSITQSDVNKFNGQKERKMTKIVIMVSLVYLALHLPNCLLYSTLVPSIVINYRSSVHRIISFISCFTLPLQVINSSVNIVIYYKLSTKFRKCLHNMLACFKNRSKFMCFRN
ncbi:FMRFamide receptor [Biomphalaria glabrata]|nr:FMRFamide receptor [Biomphalaria glabrata]